MKRHLLTVLCGLALVAACLVMGTARTDRRDATKRARELLDVAGVQGGIIVHLGCGDGTLTAALRVDDRFAVHGLEPDAANVAKARQHIQSRGLYGPVCVERHSAATLPYTDNLINLVVISDAGRVSMEEVMRVLAPRGVVCVRRGGRWAKTIKPWPNEIDEWTHFLHDASNNAVADDSLVGPPRSLQWVAPPLWLRSHETPSGIQASVSANGRLFYFFDEGLIGITDNRLPDRWSLLCRDAFNGKLLWRRPLEGWGGRQWNPQRYDGKDWTTSRGNRTDVPNENQRQIVADGDRLYATLSYAAPMSILDAATGTVLKTIPATQGTREILVSNGTVVVYTRREEQTMLVAVDGQTGEVRWQQAVGSIRPLCWAIDHGRIVHLSGKALVGRTLQTGRELWRVRPKLTTPRTLVNVDDTVVMQSGKSIVAHDATSGKPLWQKTVPTIRGGEGDDLFVVAGLVFRGIVSVDENGKPVGKSPNALVVGWGLRSGQEKKRILVGNLRSPEHHHRCYRNKATHRYLISSYEGAEFLDFQADNHGQNNWIRGACKYGMMPCNGMLYVPADQCFCQPGAKLLGFTALRAESDAPQRVIADAERLERGPAYGKVTDDESALGADWPTYRHDPARSGTTAATVSSDLTLSWKVPLKGKLTAPVVARGQVFVAQTDAHTLYALDAGNGRMRWRYTAGGRIDSPPTAYKGMVLFGSKDGRVTCLRASDGRLVWRFLAAPVDRRIGGFDQIESAWPVHGSVLVDNDTAYFTAGRSTYLDGGIHVYALEPSTGKVLHKTVLGGPHRSVQGERDLAFFILGANSDVLVSEGGYLYMRQKKLTPALEEIHPEVLSSKGAQDVGLHVFSTSGLLDGSWYNRTFWMYSKRWPGFQLANQSSKSGQLLVVDEEKTYAVRTFYRRNVHSPMFFPGKEGYLLFADENTNEPQIVGEPGWRKPIAWLPQSHIPREGNPGLDDVGRGFGADKGIGYTRAELPVWKRWLPLRIRAMVKAGQTLFVAGPPDVLDPKDPYAAFEARKGACVTAVSASDGKLLSEIPLDQPPVFDGMIAADSRLFVSCEDGSIVCLAGK